LPEQKTEAEGVTMKSQRAANRSRAAVIRVPQPARRPQPATPPSCRRRGVALIIVLGLLGLLLISAVSFAVLMRTERNAATNYRHTSSARQMLHAGLARAIEDINADIGADLCPAWTNRTIITPGLTNAYPENMFFSRDTGGDQIPARLLTKDVMTYIPVLYHRRLTDNTYATPEWIPITYSNSVIGRYAYAVIDTSGLLDAHRVYDPATNRWLGTSLGEVRLDPAILSRKDLTNTTAFVSNRDVVRAAGRYETVSELATLNGGIDYAKLANFEVFSRYSTGAVAGVTTFNLFGLTTNQLADGAVRTAIDNAFTASGCTGMAPLSTLPRQRVLYAALADYLDSDSVMSRQGGLSASQQFNRPITEKLPMLTCFGVTMTYTNSTTDFTNWTHTITYTPIINYVKWPVSDSTATDFPLSFKGALGFVNLAAPSTVAGKLSPSGTNTSLCKSGFSVPPITTAPTTSYAETPLFPPASQFSVSVTTTNNSIPFPQFDVYVCTEVYNNVNTRCTYFPANTLPRIVDLFGAGMPPPNYPAANFANWARLRVDLTGTPAASWNNGRTVTFWAECVEPRFASSAAAGDQQWRSNVVGSFPLPITNITSAPPAQRYTRSTMPLYAGFLTNRTWASRAGLETNRMDGVYELTGGGVQLDTLDAQLKMHVANAPLQTLGELGYLLCGPWETVRLYDHFPDDATTNDYHRVLDTFELRDPSATPVGKVNLNSAPVDVLALLYLGMPLRSEKAGNYIPFPPGWNSAGTDPARPLTAASTLPQALATNLHVGLRANGPVRGLADLANVYSSGSLSAQWIKNHLESLSMPNTRYIGEFEREAVIRNIAGLLTVKQQMFTIILRADAFTTRFASDRLQDGTVLSSATAIAQVYRDAAPPHKVTVRLLKILE
jgi:Tfp pilus assembly protein PilX